MKTTFAAILCSTLAGLWLASAPALAQQKTDHTGYRRVTVGCDNLR